MSNEAIYWVGLCVGVAGLLALITYQRRRRRRFDPDGSVLPAGFAVTMSGMTAWSAGRLGLDDFSDPRLSGLAYLVWGIITFAAFASLLEPGDRRDASRPARFTVSWFMWQLPALLTFLAGTMLFEGESAYGGMMALATAFLISVREVEFERARRRDAMLQRISHALRTPAAAIRSLADALDGPAQADPAQRAQFVSLIAGEADRLGTGMNRLLRLARGEPESPAERVPVDLTEWAHATAERWRLRLGTLRVVAPDRLWAEIDPDKLDEAVEALLDNALRYGGGGIELEVAETADGVAVSVQDGGPGLTEAARQRLEAIQAAPDRIPADDPSVHGFGLGLWAASQVARAHGGKLVVDPPSRITLSFPSKA